MNKQHITASGDTWDYIAFKTMGSELHMDKLIKANMAYREYRVFPAGIVLSVPEAEIPVSANLPPWKKQA